MVPVNVTVNSSQLIVQVSYKSFIILRFAYFFFVSAFCNPNTTCNGQGTCGNDGQCQCSDGLFGEYCSGKLTYCMSFPSKPCSRVFKNDFCQLFKKDDETKIFIFENLKNTFFNFKFEKQSLSTFFRRIHIRFTKLKCRILVKQLNLVHLTNILMPQFEPQLYLNFYFVYEIQSWIDNWEALCPILVGKFPLNPIKSSFTSETG